MYTAFETEKGKGRGIFEYLGVSGRVEWLVNEIGAMVWTEVDGSPAGYEF
jgi:hypothetical protein